MDDSARDTINMFLAQYDTLAIATEHDGQPFVTRAFFVEEPVNESSLRLYGTFITTSRKLCKLAAKSASWNIHWTFPAINLARSNCISTHAERRERKLNGTRKPLEKSHPWLQHL